MVGVENGSSKYDEVELYTFILTWIIPSREAPFSSLIHSFIHKYSIFIMQ